MVLRFHSKLMENPEFKRICIISTFTLIYFASWFPDFENVAGIEGTRISSVAAFGPLSGMILGPYWGAAVSFNAIILHVIVNHHLMSASTFVMLTPIFVALSSMIAGFIVTKKENIAILIYSMLIASWYLFEVGREAYMIPWFHILVLAGFILFRHVADDNASKGSLHIFTLVFLISLLGTLSDHLAGNITALLILEIPAKAFNSVILIYPVERIALACVAAFIMFMLMMLMRYTILSNNTVKVEVMQTKMESLREYIQKDVKRIINQEEDGNL